MLDNIVVVVDSEVYIAGSMAMCVCACLLWVHTKGRYDYRSIPTRDHAVSKIYITASSFVNVIQKKICQCTMMYFCSRHKASNSPV